MQPGLAMERHRKNLKFAKMDLKEIMDETDDQDIEDNKILLEWVVELIKRLEASVDRTKNILLEEGCPPAGNSSLVKQTKRRADGMSG